MVSPRLWAKSKEYQPPRPIMCLYQVAMSRALDGTFLRLLVDMCQDGVGRIAFVWAVNLFTTGNGYLVSVFSSSFRNEQVIHSVFLVDMWSFRVAPAGAFPYFL